MEQIDPSKIYNIKHFTKDQALAQYYAVNSFEAFIRLVAPYEYLSHCHIELCNWIQENLSENKLLLWPRDHKKSRKAAFYAAWRIVRNPATTILYASATAEKAEEQLRFIKTILESKQVAKYFPDLIHPLEGRRKLWNNTNIIVDHPYRDEHGVVDSTIMTCGLGKTITGKHFEHLIFDDIVVPENNTEQGRKDVSKWFAQASSIASANSDLLVVGTRYHPKDAYQGMLEMEVDSEEDEQGNVTGRKPLFQVSRANIEEDGEFLWPRQLAPNGKWYGFNKQILNKKRAIYEATGEITQFYAQYYNDPNDRSTAPISRDLFQYYDKSKLHFAFTTWELDAEPLYVFCAVDLAASLGESADYTCITVGGIDREQNIYVLDISRYKSNKISKTAEELERLHEKWRYKSLLIEAVAGFKLVATDLEDRLKSKGIRIPVEHYTPGNQEAKKVRINNILEPLYQSKRVYHYRGGNCEVLETELVSINPPNDDTKDSWAMCCQSMKAPKKDKRRPSRNNIVQFHPRFGGVAL